MRMSERLRVCARVAALLIVIGILGMPRPASAATVGFHSAWVSQDPWPTLAPGSVTRYTVRFRNVGTESWIRGVPGRQVNLGINGDDRSQSSLGVGWASPDRPAIQTEAIVGPDQIGTFTFSVRAPAQAGTYTLSLRPVADGTAWLEDEGVFLVIVSESSFHSRWLSQSPWLTMTPGQVSDPYTIAFLNTGTSTWQKGAVGIAQANLGVNGDNRSFAGMSVDWPSPDRVAIQTESSVPARSVGTFTFRVRAPSTPGRYDLHLRPVIDGVTWMEDEGVFLVVQVAPGSATPTPTPTPTLTGPPPPPPPPPAPSPTMTPTATPTVAPTPTATPTPTPTATPTPTPTPTPGPNDTVIQSGLSIPWDLAFAPDGRMFVTIRSGQIRIYASGAAGAALLSTTAVTSMHATGEAGLMGIAIDPSFASNGFVYVCASRDDPTWRNQVLRYRASGNTLTFDGYVIQNGIAANTIHDGCRIRFGFDGKLWVTMGDAANSANAQDPNSLNGKVLRVNTDGSIPTDNPILPGATGRTAAYTMGHRNPQGITFQPGTGRAFEVEHGEGTHDEINVLVAGANYGWPSEEGPTGRAGFVDPVWSSGSVTLATSGATFVTGTAWGTRDGSLFVATLKESDLRRFSVSGTTVTAAEVLCNGKYGRLRAVVQGPDGALYITTSNGSNDRIVRLAPGPSTTCTP
jgi:glucose/arabinose dehydrogenase